MDNLIYKFINQSVRNVDTYQHNGSTWLIFTNDKKWVIELTKDKTLWYNYTFFKSIFDFFSIDVVENQHYITKWVEDSIINGIKETQFNWHENKSWVNGVIQNGVNETLNTEYMPKVMVEDTIQNGVKHTLTPELYEFILVEDTIQNKVKHTNVFYDTFKGRVKDIIQNGVKQVEPLPAQDGNRDWGNYYHGKEDRTKPFNEYLDEAIRFGVKETHDDVYHHKGRIDGVIKGGKIII
jgi:predicted peroxiredoxin